MKEYSELDDIVSSVEQFNAVAGFDNRSRDIDDSDIQAQLGFIESEFNEMKEGISTRDLVETLDGAGDTLVTIIGLVWRLGFDTKTLMKIVNDSNMSKYPKSEEEAKRTVDSYASDPRYNDVHFMYVNGRYVVLGYTEDGHKKILKSVNYVDAKPQIEALVKEVIGSGE